MRALVFLALVASASLLGCETFGSAEGIVVETGGMKPVEGARVTLFCPKSGELHEPTAATGRFHLDGVWLDGPDCKVIIEKAGFATKAIPATETCRNAGEKGCQPLPRIAIDPVK